MARGTHARNTSIGWHVVATAVSLAFLASIAVMLSASFRQPGLAPPRDLELIPMPLTLEGYRQAFSQVPLARSLANSAVVSAIAVPLTIVVASWAGLAVVWASPRRRRRLVGGVLVLLMIPTTAVWVTRFLLFEKAGFVDSYVPLIAPTLIGGSPFFVLLYVLAFRRIPSDTFEAARLEGAPPLMTWRRIAMPLVRPTTLAVGMLAFVLFWSDYIGPLLYLQSESKFTAPLALRALEQLGATNWPVLLAASVAVTAPVVLVFLLAQRYFLGEQKGLSWLGR